MKWLYPIILLKQNEYFWIQKKTDKKDIDKNEYFLDTILGTITSFENEKPKIGISRDLYDFDIVVQSISKKRKWLFFPIYEIKWTFKYDCSKKKFLSKIKSNFLSSSLWKEL